MLSTIKPGTIVDSRYELLELVGEGGMGSVFRAREQELDRLVAIKFLHEGLVGDGENQARFKPEGKVLSHLNHPNILRFYRFCVWSGTMPYIAMEYLVGEDLGSILASEGKLSVDYALEIALRLSTAMHARSEQQK